MKKQSKTLPLKHATAADIKTHAIEQMDLIDQQVEIHNIARRKLTDEIGGLERAVNDIDNQIETLTQRKEEWAHIATVSIYAGEDDEQ